MLPLVNALIQTFQFRNHELLNQLISFPIKLFKFNLQQCLNHFHIIEIFQCFQIQFTLKLNLLDGYLSSIEYPLYHFFALFSQIFFQSFSSCSFILSQAFYPQLYLLSCFQQLFNFQIRLSCLIQYLLLALQIMYQRYFQLKLLFLFKLIFLFLPLVFQILEQFKLFLLKLLLLLLFSHLFSFILFSTI